MDLLEDASSSMLCNAKMNPTTAETSDSFNSHYYCRIRPAKRPRLELNNSNIFAAKFKGVVPQHNGHWGAQIYAKHQRIWLGTFKSEKEAAMAYDSAAIKIRSGDSHRNLPWTERNIQEPDFQSQYTTEAVLNMIRDGSYQPKFADFLRKQTRRQEAAAETSLSLNNNTNQTRVHGGDHGKFSFIQLFQKELTPSDVGKLNRLVIPKKFAVKYFPYISGNMENDKEHGLGHGLEDVELVFYDRLMKSWKFRYCYWRSSQSFVFTRGWNRFVKEKNLKEKDIVTFYACVSSQRIQEGQQFCLIDISYGNGQSCSTVVDAPCQIEEMQKELELNLGQSIRNKLQEDHHGKEKRFRSGLEFMNSNKGKGLRLFGVQID
ncbi:AP2/ERF and B3 domain-containing transcription factor At1g50680 [Manihot esculenta]|uniref:AP2/ERF and B3 domain-containing transcription factor n=2 Tax=Manihot esculenta TaxID=3983 RepID=A0A2C9VHU4_MANES|nr:AP2/ERF and B3 domain-containing transcription factor At1g50680 [Manihot esculenta]KAG8657796.1 hypothetical protein MANES_03G090396v8 [Manihot esculenta]